MHIFAVLNENNKNSIIEQLIIDLQQQELENIYLSLCPLSLLYLVLLSERIAERASPVPGKLAFPCAEKILIRLQCDDVLNLRYFSHTEKNKRCHVWQRISTFRSSARVVAKR